MKKKVMALVLSSLMAVGLLAGCASAPAAAPAASEPAAAVEEAGEAAPEAAADTADLPKVSMDIICGSIPSETPSIEAALTEITKEYGFRVELIPIEIGNSGTQLNLLLSGGDDTLDVYWSGVGGLTFNTVVNAGQALELDEYVAPYLDDLKSALGENVVNAGYINGKLMGLGRLLDQASTPVYNLRADIAAQYGYKNGDKINLELLTELFEKIRADYPDTPLIGPMNGAPNIGDCRVDALSNRLGVLGNYGQDETVIDYYSSEYFAELVDYFAKWKEMGCYMPDILNTTDAPSDYIPSGKCFGCFASHFSAEMNGIWASQNYGCDMASLQIYEDAVAITPGAFYHINPACKNPDKAATWLWLMATNKDVVNLLINGIEGQDYQVLEDGTFAYCEGKDVATTGWCMGYSWCALNSSISTPFNYPADYYDQMLEANKTAKQSKAFGCMFDLTEVADEVTACTNVVNQYFNALEGGAVDDIPAAYEQFKADLQTAGIDKIVAAKQAQLDAFLGK